MEYLYVRCSKEESSYENQIHILKEKFPNAEVVTETISGGAKNKPILNALIERLQPNDVLAVYALDRLGRTGGGSITLVKDLLDKGIKIYSHREQFDFTTAIGEYMSGQMLLVAQLERKLISERIKTALSRKKDEAKRTNSGWRCGRKNRITEQEVFLIVTLRTQGKTIREISALTKVSIGRISLLLRERSAA